MQASRRRTAISGRRPGRRVRHHAGRPGVRGSPRGSSRHARSALRADAAPGLSNRHPQIAPDPVELRGSDLTARVALLGDSDRRAAHHGRRIARDQRTRDAASWRLAVQVAAGHGTARRTARPCRGRSRGAHEAFKAGRAWQPHAWMVRFHRRSVGVRGQCGPRAFLASRQRQPAPSDRPDDHRKRRVRRRCALGPSAPVPAAS
jgi:hypothetical protein